MLLSHLLFVILIIISSELFYHDYLRFQAGLVQGSTNVMNRVNDTFSISGALLSTIRLDSNMTQESSYLQPGEIGFKDALEENQPIADLSSQTRFDEFSQRSSASMTLNQTDNLSNNLVSMLSGIIIQSIEKGNPTINKVNLSDPTQLMRENVPIVLVGNWQLSVIKSKVTMFDARFVMITSNGTGFHWHGLGNLESEKKIYFGKDDNIHLLGTVDFLTNNKVIYDDIKIAIVINNLETVQIIFLDEKVSSHLYSHPVYGTVDKIEIPN